MYVVVSEELAPCFHELGDLHWQGTHAARPNACYCSFHDAVSEDVLPQSASALFQRSQQGPAGSGGRCICVSFDTAGPSQVLEELPTEAAERAAESAESSLALAIGVGLLPVSAPLRHGRGRPDGALGRWLSRPASLSFL